MSTTPIFFSLSLDDGALVHLYLNDLPVTKGLFRGADSVAGQINDFLVPGENEVALEILRAPTAVRNINAEESAAQFKDTPGGPQKPTFDTSGSVTLLIHTISDPQRLPAGDDLIYQCAFPQLWGEVESRRKRLPYFHTDRFTPRCAIYERVWLKAPVSTFDCTGTPELQRAVAELHGALDSGNVARFIQLTELQTSELGKSLGVPSYATMDRERHEQYFGQGFDVRPLEPDALHYSPRAGGRVAHVTRYDGGPVLEARSLTDPKLVLRADILLTQHEGRWCVM